MKCEWTWKSWAGAVASCEGRDRQAPPLTIAASHDRLESSSRPGRKGKEARSRSDDRDGFGISPSVGPVSLEKVLGALRDAPRVDSLAE